MKNKNTKSKKKIQIYMPKGVRLPVRTGPVLKGQETSTGQPNYLEKFTVNAPLMDLTKLR